MRIKINLSSCDTPLNINNQFMVNSYIHRVLGENNPYHDTPSDYVVSNLRGGKWIPGSDTIDFSNGGFIVLSTIDNEFLNKILLGLFSGIEFGKGIRFTGIDYIEEKIYVGGVNHFRTLTPILLKGRKGEQKFLTIEDSKFVNELESRTKNRLNKIKDNLDWGDFKIVIKEHTKHKVRSVLIKDIINRASECQIDIYGSKGVLDLIYNTGIGQSCGSGFGLLVKTESKKIYS